MRGFIRRYRKLVWAIGSILAVILALVLFCILCNPEKYQPIGDELFDRYAEMVM